MEKKEIYFLFTDTGSLLAKAINRITGHPYNHVSIGFDEALQEVYSFGRKNEKNPFIGGFVKENINCDFLKNAVCEIYSCEVTAEECQSIIRKIKEIEAKSNHYRYNFIGLFGILLQIEINRKCALFCSQFVATVAADTGIFNFSKPACFVTPADIRSHKTLKLLYKGTLSNYPKVISQQESKVKHTEYNGNHAFG
ncbi:hypothetical protein [Virgibacillus sp. YIM 98842]|uniref:hypothetical protein n=1 Tax=Virgibacillus sp. YIM 98842 TaxID=2663533 RepID=UPI001969DA56|nr:hypothetical protein [Virgibacillus sp. YIM 98842]